MEKAKIRKKTLMTAKSRGKRRTIAPRSAAPKRKKPSNLVTKTKNKKPKAKPSVEELLKKVKECVENFEHNLALQYCETALTVAPSNVEVLETTGGLLLELGDVNRAIQLSEGAEAVKLLLKGIDVMVKQFHCQGASSSASSLGPTDVTALDVSTAYCSLAEVYLTDCCFDDDAEVKCGEYCTKALEYSSSNPEAYQIMGSYLLSKQDFEKARTMLLQGLSLWLPATDDTDVDLQQVPSYQSQVNWAKLLMEVEEHQNAHLVLEQLLREDDEMMEVWYLLGWLAHLEDDLSTAVKCLRRCKELYTISGCMDEQMLVHTDQLLEELGDQPATDDADHQDGDSISSSNEMELT